MQFQEYQHSVVVSRGYWLADTTCTQALWQAVMGENPSNFKGDKQAPVGQVSWHDVQGFLAELNRQVPGLQAGLPTEAQWEYACRAGTQSRYSFGGRITELDVNFSRGGLNRQGRSVAVKSLPPNGWGLYEMHGNVWEWCADWYAEYGAEEQIDPIGPHEPRNDAGRIVRGGSWLDGQIECRSASRHRVSPDGRGDSIGFRFVVHQLVEKGGKDAGRHADSAGEDAAALGGFIAGILASHLYPDGDKR